MFFNNFSNIFYNGFPPEMKKAVRAVTNLIPRVTYRNINICVSKDETTYFLNNNADAIIVPHRIYFLEIEDCIIENLNNLEKIVLHCIYSRSCDGYVREKHIKALLSIEFPEWAIPYIVKICDEYVIEILRIVYEDLKEKNTDDIKRFCVNNWDCFCKSYNRMISYWNEFYRHDCYNFENYVGRKLFIECFGANRKMKCTK